MPNIRQSSSDRSGELQPIARVQFGLRGLFLFLFVSSMVCALWFRVLMPARESARQRECENKLQQIGLGLHGYHDVWGCFPDAEKGISPIYKLDLSPLPRPRISEREAVARLDHLLGHRGVASTPLVPGGKGRIGDELVDVLTDGEFIDRGMPIEVVEVHGNRVIVRGLS